MCHPFRSKQGAAQRPQGPGKHGDHDRLTLDHAPQLQSTGNKASFRTQVSKAFLWSGLAFVIVLPARGAFLRRNLDKFPHTPGHSARKHPLNGLP